MHNTHDVLLKNRSALSGRIALVGLSDPALLAALPGGGVGASDHFGVYQTIRQTPGWEAHYGYLGPCDAAADTAVVFVPKARAELALRLDMASRLLVPDGQLLLVGEKREGVASAVKQLKALAPDAVKIDSARHCQVWCSRRPAYEPGPVSAWLDWHTVTAAGHEFSVAGLPGIFSAGRLDDGTRMLLETLRETPVTGPVLDFACGAGVIGAWLRTGYGPELVIDGVDVQAQAVFCARQTYHRAGVNGRIKASDGLAEVSGQYQSVITNPPFHSGVSTDLSMTTAFLRQVADHLLPAGELRLVANRFLPYADLIEQAIGPVSVLAQDRRFTVYRAFRSARGDGRLGR